MKIVLKPEGGKDGDKWTFRVEKGERVSEKWLGRVQKSPGRLGGLVVDLLGSFCGSPGETNNQIIPQISPHLVINAKSRLFVISQRGTGQKGRKE